MARIYAGRFSPRLNAVLSKVAEKFRVGIESEADSLVEVKPVCWKIEADFVEDWGRLVAVLSRPASGVLLYLAGALKSSEGGLKIVGVEREDVETATASLGKLLAEPSKLKDLRDPSGFGLYASLLEGACKAAVQENFTLIAWVIRGSCPPVRVFAKAWREI